MQQKTLKPMQQKTLKPIHQDTYKKTGYRGWENSNSVKQGCWSYDAKIGYWFFGDQFKEFRHKEIKRLLISIERIEGGKKKPVNFRVKAHNFAEKPKGAPVGWKRLIGMVKMNIGDKHYLVVEDEELIKRIISLKGICIDPENSTRNNYAVCGECEVQVFYE